MDWTLVLRLLLIGATAVNICSAVRYMKRSRLPKEIHELRAENAFQIWVVERVQDESLKPSELVREWDEWIRKNGYDMDSKVRLVNAAMMWEGMMEWVKQDNNDEPA